MGVLHLSLNLFLVLMIGLHVHLSLISIRRHLFAFRGALSPTFVNDKVARGGGAMRVIPESWSPTRCRRRRNCDLAHPLPFVHKVDARVLVIRFNSHHPFLPFISRGWYDCLRGRGSWSWRSPRCWSAHTSGGRPALGKKVGQFLLLVLAETHICIETSS